MMTMTMTLHITHAGGYLNDCHVVLLVCKYLMLFCHETTDWHVIQSGIPRCYPSGLSLIGRLLGILASDWMTIVNLVSIENMNLTWQWHCTCAPGHLFVYYCISNKNLLLFSILHFVLELVNFSFLMSKKFYFIACEWTQSIFESIRIDFIKSSQLWTMIHRVN